MSRLTTKHSLRQQYELQRIVLAAVLEPVASSWQMLLSKTGVNGSIKA